MVYRLPTDSDGVKYHGVVDPDGDNPGQVLYGVDENGNYRPVKVDNNGNVLTQVTGSRGEIVKLLERGVYSSEDNVDINITIPKWAKGIVLTARYRGSTGDAQGIGLEVRNLDLSVLYSSGFSIKTEPNTAYSSGVVVYPNLKADVMGERNFEYGFFPLFGAQDRIKILVNFVGNFAEGEGIEAEVSYQFLS